MSDKTHWGFVTVERHQQLKQHGTELRVWVRGEDVTDRCKLADDTPGREMALLYRHNSSGHPHLDEDGLLAMQLAGESDDIEILPVGERPIQETWRAVSGWVTHLRSQA